MRTDTKTALLNSAEAAARVRGFDGFSYADLARDVGIRKASIHHHFPSKADLSVAMMTRYTQAMADDLDMISARYASAGQHLAALITLYKSALHDGTSQCLCVAFSVSIDSLPVETAILVVQFRTMMVDWLTHVFEHAVADHSIAGVVHPKDEAAATLALLEGAHLAAHAAQDVDVFDASVSLLAKRMHTQGF
ncbi:MAG: TetR/AcrR family transcriptional regulator [Planktomarina sp.]